MLKHVKVLGGMPAIAEHNARKAKLLYDFLDGSQLFRSPVAEEDRSLMNVTFWLKDDALNEHFLTGAERHGLVQLKGHRSVGGMRASIYNAMPPEGVQTLVRFMHEFERSHMTGETQRECSLVNVRPSDTVSEKLTQINIRP